MNRNPLQTLVNILTPLIALQFLYTFSAEILLDSSEIGELLLKLIVFCSTLEFLENFVRNKKLDLLFIK